MKVLFVKNIFSFFKFLLIFSDDEGTLDGDDSGNESNSD